MIARWKNSCDGLASNQLLESFRNRKKKQFTLMMNIFGSHETSKANFSNSTKDVNSIITLQSHRFFMIVLNQFDLKLADFVKLCKFPLPRYLLCPVIRWRKIQREI